MSVFIPLNSLSTFLLNQDLAKTTKAPPAIDIAIPKTPTNVPITN